MGIQAVHISAPFVLGGQQIANAQRRRQHLRPPTMRIAGIVESVKDGRNEDLANGVYLRDVYKTYGVL